MAFLPNGDILTVLGDASAHSVDVPDHGTNGAGNITATGVRASFSSTSHVRAVVVATCDGNDEGFSTMPDLATNFTREVDTGTVGACPRPRFPLGGLRARP